MRPVMSLLRQIAGRSELSHVSIQKPGFKMELRRHPAGAAGAASVSARSGRGTVRHEIAPHAQGLHV